MKKYKVVLKEKRGDTVRSFLTKKRAMREYREYERMLLDEPDIEAQVFLYNRNNEVVTSFLGTLEY